jgi:hypothetical protein
MRRMLQPWRTVHSVKARGSRPLDGILSDIQSARRALWRAPAFFCVASLTLAGRSTTHRWRGHRSGW